MRVTSGTKTWATINKGGDMREPGLIPFVGYFKVRLELVGAFGHATEEALLNSLVNTEPEEFYLVCGFLLERLLECQQATVLVHHLQYVSFCPHVTVRFEM